ncbi:MAG TPA: PIN domain-containing protein [Thermoanaerobaculia bacterium]|nr:PIN domain-containing protein [Thermoanaerobaculia bacterium]
MPPEYFADTWYLVALHDRFDNHHLPARRLRARYGGGRLITHEMVLTEVLALFSRRGAAARAVAVTVVRELMREGEVVTPDRRLFLRAVDLYASRPDKEYSLVDCMSMVLMRERGIDHVLTNDHHFRQEGFTVLSDAP